MLPQPGNVVQVRSRQYLVDDVRVGDRAAKQRTVVSLSCLDDDAQGHIADDLGPEVAAPPSGTVTNCRCVLAKSGLCRDPRQRAPEALPGAVRASPARQGGGRAWSTSSANSRHSTV